MIPIAQIIERCGGHAAVAEACGIDRTSTYSWQRVPTKHLAAVARLGGYLPSELRPDLAEAFEPAPTVRL